MTRGRPLSLAALLSAASLLVLVVWVYHDAILYYAFWGGAGWAGWKLLKHKVLGLKQRPKSSWSSLMRSWALLFAAWNTRWLKPTTHKASITQKAGDTSHSRPDGWDVA